jgi:hypothetical protein
MNECYYKNENGSTHYPDCLISVKLVCIKDLDSQRHVAPPTTPGATCWFDCICASHKQSGDTDRCHFIVNKNVTKVIGVSFSGTRLIDGCHFVMGPDFKEFLQSELQRVLSAPM